MSIYLKNVYKMSENIKTVRERKNWPIKKLHGEKRRVFIQFSQKIEKEKGIDKNPEKLYIFLIDTIKFEIDGRF